jgi:hypothetical protein
MGLAIQELGAAHASKGRNASHPGPNALAGGNRTTAPRRVHSHAELADSLSDWPHGLNSLKQAQRLLNLQLSG